MSLYILIDLLSISIPLVVSFHPRIALYQQWKPLFLAIFLAAVPYIIWDIFFTKLGYWGFNEAYLSGVNLFGLPLGEWLFFICIPFACIFTHFSILAINPKLRLGAKVANWITVSLLATFLTVLLFFGTRAYTAVDMLFGIVILGIASRLNSGLLRSFYITFLFMLIPFFLVNGILTGSGIVNEIVWYNNSQNLGLRLLTIPIEDVVYAFSLILLNLLFFEGLKSFFDNKGQARMDNQSQG